MKGLSIYSSSCSLSNELLTWIVDLDIASSSKNSLLSWSIKFIKMLRFIKYRFSKEVLDYSKAAPKRTSLPTVNCMVLHPVFYPNKGPELELYLAEEAVGLSKSLNWSLEKGPFWKEEYTKKIRRSQGRAENIETIVNDETQLQE